MQALVRSQIEAHEQQRRLLAAEREACAQDAAAQNALLAAERDRAAARDTAPDWAAPMDTDITFDADQALAAALHLPHLLPHFLWLHFILAPQALVHSQIEAYDRQRRALAAERDAARAHDAAARSAVFAAAARDAARDRAAARDIMIIDAARDRAAVGDAARDPAQDSAAPMETDNINADEALAAALQLAGDGDGAASASASESPRYGPRGEQWGRALGSREALQQR